MPRSTKGPWGRSRGETFITESKSSRAGENGPARRRYSKIVMLYFIVVGQLLRNASGRWPVGLLRNGHQPVLHEGGLILYHHYGHSLEPFNPVAFRCARFQYTKNELKRGFFSNLKYYESGKLTCTIIYTIYLKYIEIRVN